MENETETNTQTVADGPHLQLLKGALYATYQQIATNVTKERFQEIFREHPVSKKKQFCRKACDIFRETLIKDFEREVDDLLNTLAVELDLNNVLSLRAQIIEDQKVKEGTNAWRPTGEPRDDIRAHDMPYLRENVYCLEILLEDSERCRSQYMHQVVEARAKTAELAQTVRELTEQVKELYERFGEVRERRLHTLDMLLSPTDLHLPMDL